MAGVLKCTSLVTKKNIWSLTTYTAMDTNQDMLDIFVRSMFAVTMEKVCKGK